MIAVSQEPGNDLYEGLATLNTLLPLRDKSMWSVALLYYAAAKAQELNFTELFDHLERYVPNKEVRWKQVRGCAMQRAACELWFTASACRLCARNSWWRTTHNPVGMAVAKLILRGQ